MTFEHARQSRFSHSGCGRGFQNRIKETWILLSWHLLISQITEFETAAPTFSLVILEKHVNDSCVLSVFSTMTLLHHLHLLPLLFIEVAPAPPRTVLTSYSSF